MPEQVDECVESVLEDNPEYSESKAWAICKAQFEADIDDPTVEALAEVDVDAAALDELAAQTVAWERVASDDAVAWIDTAGGAAVYEAVAEQQADGFAADVFQVVQRGDDGPVADGALLGLGVDMPNAGVYVDWNIDAWPDDEQLTEPHVSDYGSIEDLEQATGGAVEVIETVRPEEEDAGLTQQATTIDAVALEYLPGGEVIDHDAGDWEAFLDDLAEHGDVFQVWKGIQRHPEDDLGSHDHATYVALDDGDVTDLEAVLEDHPAVHYTINAGTVGPMDHPDDWAPAESDHYHGVDGVDQQAADRPPAQLVVHREELSQDERETLREAIERRHNVTVTEATDE